MKTTQGAQECDTMSTPILRISFGAIENGEFSFIEFQNNIVQNSGRPSTFP